MNGGELLSLALEYIANTPTSSIEFGRNPTALDRKPWRVRAECSTLITALQRELGRTAAERVQLFGKSWPRARDYHAAILAESGFKKVQRVEEVRPGDLLAIKFSSDQDGFSGHAALIASVPEQWIPGVWRVEVVDSTNNPHGALDPRATGNYRGLGKAGMMLLVDKSGVIEGYKWSPTAEPRLIQDGERLVAIGRWV